MTEGKEYSDESGLFLMLLSLLRMEGDCFDCYLD
jgi:hypothetical protein